MESYLRTLEIMNEKHPEVIVNLLKSKIFTLNDKVVHSLLLKTSNKISNRKLPFNPMFIDSFQSGSMNNGKVGFTFDGFYLQEEPKTNSFMIFTILEFGGDLKTGDIPINKIGFSVYDYGLNDNEINEVANKCNVTFKPLKKMLNGLAEYVCNFLDFINNPDVEIVTVERTKEQNTKRIKRGKFPFPPMNHIKVTGKLKIYIDELRANGNLSTYSHRFWVRGHFRVLRNERYKDKVGMKIWIVPFIKGQGILVNKIYDVEKPKIVKT